LTTNIGTNYQVTVPTLSDKADIVEAFKYYHTGGITGSIFPNSVESHLATINDDITKTRNAIGYTSYDPINPATTVQARLVSLETVVGTSLASTYVKMIPSSNDNNDTRNFIQPSGSTIVPLTIQGVIAQTADLQRWNSSATTVAKVDSSGKMYSFDGTGTNEVVTISGTQTLTNKTLTNPIQTIGTNQRNASYTLVASDQSKMIEVNSSSGTTITIPNESVTTIFPVGTYIAIMQTGTGQVTIAGNSFTPNATPGLKTRTQWSLATLIKRDTNSWVVTGDLVP